MFFSSGELVLVCITVYIHILDGVVALFYVSLDLRENGRFIPLVEIGGMVALFWVSLDWWESSILCLASTRMTPSNEG